jgi:hypothetical protein
MWIKTNENRLINSEEIIEIFIFEDTDDTDNSLFSVRAYDGDSSTIIESFKTIEEAKEYIKILYIQLNANVQKKPS